MKRTIGIVFACSIVLSLSCQSVQMVADLIATPTSSPSPTSIPKVAQASDNPTMPSPALTTIPPNNAQATAAATATKAASSGAGFGFHPWKVETKPSQKPGYKKLIVSIALENTSTRWQQFVFTKDVQDASPEAELTTDEGNTYKMTTGTESENCELKTLGVVPPGLLVFGVTYAGAIPSITGFRPDCLVFNISQNDTPNQLKIRGYNVFAQNKRTIVHEDAILDLKQIETNLQARPPSGIPTRKISQTINVPQSSTILITAVRGNIEADWSVTSGGSAFFGANIAFYNDRGILFESSQGGIALGIGASTMKGKIGTKNPNDTSNSSTHWWLLATQMSASTPKFQGDQPYGIDEVIQLK